MMAIARGLKGFQIALKRTLAISDAAAREQRKPLTKALLIIERAAKDNTRKNVSRRPGREKKRMGLLRSSISHAITSRTEGIVGAHRFYAPFVEFGTGRRGAERPIIGGLGLPADYIHGSGIGAQPYPFMRPALADNRDKIADALNEGNRVITEVTLRRG